MKTTKQTIKLATCNSCDSTASPRQYDGELLCSTCGCHYEFSMEEYTHEEVYGTGDDMHDLYEEEAVYTHCDRCNVEFSSPSTWLWCSPCDNELADDAEEAQANQSMEWVERDMQE